MTPVRLEPTAFQSRDKHSTTESLCSHKQFDIIQLLGRRRAMPTTTVSILSKLYKRREMTIYKLNAYSRILEILYACFIYSKNCLKRSLQKKTRIGFQDRLSLNAGQKYCRMLQESILQYFRPSLSYHLSLRPLFCLFLVGRLRQVLLYVFAERI